MIALLLATLLAAGPAASPAAALPHARPTASPRPDITPPPAFNVDPSWLALPAQDVQYAAFARPNPGEPEDLPLASKQKCDCIPADSVAMLTSTFKPYNPTIKDSAVQFCGEPAEHVLVENVANFIGRRNVDAYFFREGQDLYTVQLGFSAKQPSASDEASLAALCPPAA